VVACLEGKVALLVRLAARLKLGVRSIRYRCRHRSEDVVHDEEDSEIAYDEVEMFLHSVYNLRRCLSIVESLVDGVAKSVQRDEK